MYSLQKPFLTLMEFLLRSVIHRRIEQSYIWILIQKPFIHTGWHAVCTKANKNNKGRQLFDIKTMGQIIVVQKFFIIIFYVRNHVPFHNHLYSNPYPVAHEFGCTYIHFQY